jgi:hypothetical protein
MSWSVFFFFFFEIYATFELDDIFLNSVVTRTHSALLGVEQRSVVIEWPREYTYDEHCDMFLILSHGIARKAILVGVIDANVLTGAVSIWDKKCSDDTYGTRNANRSRLHGHQPMNMPQLQLWNDNRRGHATSHENWGNPHWGSSKYLIAISWKHTTIRGLHVCFQTIVLYGCNVVAVGWQPHIGNLDYCKITTTSVYLEIYWTGSCSVVNMRNNYVDVATRGHWLSRRER